MNEIFQKAYNYATSKSIDTSKIVEIISDYLKMADMSMSKKHIHKRVVEINLGIY